MTVLEFWGDQIGHGGALLRRKTFWESKMRTHLLIGMMVLAMCVSAKATTLYYYDGFEPTQPQGADFYDSTTNTQGLGITVVPNGGGTLHLTAPNGTHYAEITNTDDTYQTGYGESVYTDYGAQRLGSGVVTSNGFYESTAYYINTGWAAASPDNNYEGFWIDSTPATDPGYVDETNFRIVDTGNGTIGVQFVGLNGIGSTSITTSGWYTFRTTFEESPTGNIRNIMSVISQTGTVIGSYISDSS